MEWYSLSVTELIRKTKCQPEKGLTDREVKKQRQQYGFNELLQEKGQTADAGGTQAAAGGDSGKAPDFLHGLPPSLRIS